MKDHARRIAYLAILTAMGAGLLLLSRLLPAGRLGMMVLASFPVCAALMLYGPGWALGVFAATAALGFLLCPGTAAVGYAAFFGYYPIAKSFFERSGKRLLEWILKYCLYIAAFAVYWFAAQALFGAEGMPPWYLLLLLGAAAFAVYDWCYSLVIRFYIEKIARYIP